MTTTRASVKRLAEEFAKRSAIIMSLSTDTHILEQITKLTEDCIHSIQAGGKILICGNGGFAAIAQHVASELEGKLHTKRNPLPALALTTDMAVLTCIANDFGFERIFSRQLKAISSPADMLISLTTSGKSKNILQALAEGRRIGIKTYAIVGDGCGKLASELSAETIELPSKQTEVIQDLAMMTLHMVCERIEDWSIGTDSSSANIWQTIADTAKKEGADTLLLDRDGVMNHLLPNEYLLEKERLVMNRELLQEARTLAATFRKIIIVSNQACIGKGKATKEEVESINETIIKEFEKAGGKIDGVYICPDSDSESPNRKPNTGMAEQILTDHPEIDLKKSIMAGDSYSDELFAQRVGSIYFNIDNI